MRQRIESLEQFRALQADYMAARDAEKRKILVCCGTGCVAGGNLNVYHELKKRMDELGIPCEVSLTEHHADTIGLKKSGCHGFCEMGPLVHIEPMGVMYIHVKPEDCHEILEKTVLGGEVIDRLVYHLDGTAYPKQEDIPFYKKQHRVVLENCGTSDAEDIEEYIAKGGYSSDGSTMIDLYAMTQEQYDAVLALIHSTHRVLRYDESIQSIISAETASFFAGETTAEETASRIQNRVRLYIAEQS